ncbi:MAG: DNA polymerase Y family protein [Sphingomonadaceae bacterium]|nr:DNA polymerase Y family protein [Sphingomonadaceae bacterium]
MPAEASATRRYLAAYLPLLPAERLVRQRTKSPDAPFALVEKERGAMRLAACDAGALKLGIIPGMTLADARARVPGLLAFDSEPAADTRLLEWLADGCERYTPSCALRLPQGLLLDISGCLHLHESEGALAGDLKARLRHGGMTVRLALGNTPDSAFAKARFAVKDISALPVEALEVDAKIHVALKRAGLRSIGDLAVRPRQSLAARFGKMTVVKLARLLEEEDARITPRRSLPVVHVERNFAEPVARTDDVLATIEALAGEAAILLRERGEGGRRFEVSLFRSDGHVARLAVETGGPTRDAILLMRLIRERIDALADQLDPGFGYDLIRLAVPLAERLDPVQVGLERRVDAKAEAAALVDRLGVRLGIDAIRHFHARDTHIPERAALEAAAIKGPSSGQWPKPQPGEPAMRPFRLFDPPQQVEVIAAVPDGPPLQFRWRRRLHQIVLHEGPERIAPEWWRRKTGHEPGQGGPTRDYYRVEDSKGRRFWLFRHGLYNETSNPHWYLHGLFA